MKAKISGIVLTLFLLAPMVGAYLFLHHQKTLVRQEVKERIIEGLNREELVMLKFSYADANNLLEWEHEKEFEYRGQMYDVVETDRKGDSVWYWCWLDREETELNQKIDELIARALINSPEKKDSKEIISDFFKQLYYSNCPSSTMIMNVQIAHYKHLNEHLQIIYQEPPVPPPRLG